MPGLQPCDLCSLQSLTKKIKLNNFHSVLLLSFSIELFVKTLDTNKIQQGSDLPAWF